MAVSNFRILFNVVVMNFTISNFHRFSPLKYNTMSHKFILKCNVAKVNVSSKVSISYREFIFHFLVRLFHVIRTLNTEKCDYL